MWLKPQGVSSNTNYKTTTTTLTYDAAGHQTEMREHTEGASLDDRIRTFAYDGNGMILARRDGTEKNGAFQQNTSDGKAATGVALGHLNQRYVYADGQQVVSMDQGGTLDALSRVTAFSNTEAGNEHVTVQAGDTLRTLAQRVYSAVRPGPPGRGWTIAASATDFKGIGPTPAAGAAQPASGKRQPWAAIGGRSAGRLACRATTSGPAGK